MSRPTYFATNGHLLLCTGRNCQARGAEPLFAALWQALETQELAYYKRGGTVRLSESGCLGACSFGPTLCVYRQAGAGLEQKGLEEGWYAPTDLPLALAVAQAVQGGVALPTRNRYGPPQWPGTSTQQ